MQNFNDQQALAFVTGQSYEINSRVYETKFPDWDFSKFLFVDTSGSEWAQGVVTFSTDITGRADWQSGYAKDVPLADVSQGRDLRSFSMGAIGYQWNIEEVNNAVNIGVGLVERRARAARKAYTKFMYDLTIKGDSSKNLGGLINYSGITATTAPADGVGGVTFWVDEDGVGTKTPAQIRRDVGLMLSGIQDASFDTEMANTILLPPEAYAYIDSTPFSPLHPDSILAVLIRDNPYTRMTGRPLAIHSLRELSLGAAGGATGRAVAYRNDQDYVKLHLPMPHKFLSVHQDGPLNWVVPGIFRTGGVEVMTDVTFRYLDGISEPRA